MANRLLENGSRRLIESGSIRLLEPITTVDLTVLPASHREQGHTATHRERHTAAHHETFHTATHEERVMLDFQEGH